MNADGRNTYITDKNRYEYHKRLSSQEAMDLFMDKAETYRLFHDYYSRDVILVRGKEDLETFRSFIEKHRTIIIKPQRSSGGRRIRIAAADTKVASEKLFSEIMKQKGAVCEQLIRQSESMASLHPESVNTVRITTIRTPLGVHMLYPLLRVGSGNSVVDNAMSGGLFALVDPESGVISSRAKDEKGNTYIRHPDTGICFPGFQLPDWQDALILTKKLTNIRQDAGYVGWDLAHTQNGWVMVEGNSHAQLLMQQMFFTRGFRNEIDCIMMEELSK